MEEAIRAPSMGASGVIQSIRSRQAISGSTLRLWNTATTSVASRPLSRSFPKAFSKSFQGDICVNCVKS